MAISLKKLFEPTLLTSSVATIYTLEEASTAIVENLVLRLTNVTTTGQTATGYAVPEGETAGVTNQIFNASVPANDFVLVTVPVLKKGDLVRFKQTDSGDIINIQHESGLPKEP